MLKKTLSVFGGIGIPYRGQKLDTNAKRRGLPIVPMNSIKVGFAPVSMLNGNILV